MNDDEGQETSQLKTPPFSDKNGAAGLDKWGCLLNTIEIMGQTNAESGTDPNDEPVGSDTESGTEPNDKPVSSDTESRTEPIV
ncbi:hypothetical protein V6N12_045818 [Hibiscus sabdariffa]|uniref:Uncharacterized protein n=1 Tax=Hibiscus sabdariffa TaxID=183260 RepID=A0ABR2G3U8_9ROSI